jgi:hypothetical protein
VADVCVNVGAESELYLWDDYPGEVFLYVGDEELRLSPDEARKLAYLLGMYADMADDRLVRLQYAAALS